MKSCPICDCQFELKKNSPNQIFCSTKCKGNAYHRAKRNLPLKLKQLICIVCDKKYFQRRANNTKYCSKSCKKLGVFRRYAGLPVKGCRKHVKGSGYIQANGYKVISKKHPNASKRGQILEHKLIMSEHLGRPIAKHETVHHKNGIRHDNRLENLELWSHSHPFGQRVEDKIAWAIDFLKEYGYLVTKKT